MAKFAIKNLSKLTVVWRTGTEEQKWKVEYAALFVYGQNEICLACPYFIPGPMLIFPSLHACIVTSLDSVLRGGLSIKKHSHTTLTPFCHTNLTSTLLSVIKFINPKTYVFRAIVEEVSLFSLQSVLPLPAVHSLLKIWVELILPAPSLELQLNQVCTRIPDSHDT